jgi:uncharacterized membrane protein
MELVFVLIGLGLLLGAVLGWVSFFKIQTLQKQVSDLQRSLHNITYRLEKLGASGREIDKLSHNQNAAIPASPEQQNPIVEELGQANASAAAGVTNNLENAWTGESPAGSSDIPATAFSVANLKKETEAPSLFSRLRDQWMIWLGGLSIGLSGIFMVRYSIEQGLLDPMARVLLSITVGLILHGVAEWGRRRSVQQFQALAALAGGSSIILFAAIAASLNLYDLFPPTFVFIALIAVSLGTMALAVLHGPVLAILGILSAYVIPALVSTGSGNAVSVLMYSIIITAASLLLMRYVYRPWIWASMLAGSLGWWLLTLDSYDALGYRGYYLAALLYLFLALPKWDWFLVKPFKAQAVDAASESSFEPALSVKGIWGLIKIKRPGLPKQLSETPGTISLVILILAVGLTISSESRVASAIYQWTPFFGILLVAAGSRVELLKLAALSLGVQLLAWLTLGLSSYNGLRLVGLIGPGQFDFLIFAAWMAFVFTALSLKNLKVSVNRNFWCALAVASPLLWLSLSYLLVTDLSESIYWGAASVALGVFYLLLAAWRLRLDKLQPLASDEAERECFAVWLILAGHFAYSLAVAIMVREAGLTLALSAQILSIAWLIHRYNPPHLGLFLKLVLAVVVMRLTLNPWLLTYPADVHWSFWTYGGATAFAALSAWHLRDNEKLGKWLELAALHLLVLTLWAETRYYLYDGDIFKQQFDLVEFSINTALWSSLALVYYLRHKVSQNLKPLYLLASKILMVMGLASYLIVLFFLNPFWTGEVISQTPIFNILLLSYGLPVVIAVLLYLYYDRAVQSKIAVFAAISAFVFINIEIKHLWSGMLSVHASTSNGELYTYTIVWLVLAIACLLAGSIRFGANVYRAGFGLMMIVIAKIFLFDMADLEGLLRVASFMGLGLSLLGLAYLYQRFNLSPKKVVP